MTKFGLRFYFVAQCIFRSYWCSFNGQSKVFIGSNFQPFRIILWSFTMYIRAGHPCQYFPNVERMLTFKGIEL